MGVDAGSVYSSIRIRLTDLDNDLKGVYARLNQLESNITKTTVPSQKNFKEMFAAVFTGQAALALAQKGFSLLTGAIKDSIRVATESQEMISRYDVVFSNMGQESEDAANRFADSFDLASATAKEMLSNTGNLLQGFGATREESLALSEQVNTLAADLSSFTNNQGGAKVASEALTKALLGEREQAKTLGIAILESDVQARLAAKGQDKLEGTALKLAKANVTLELITEQAKNSIGDYARTADSAANSQKRAEENTKKLQVAIGGALNPVVTIASNLWSKISGSLSEVITKQTELSAAEKATKEGNVTLEQRLILLENEKKAIEEKGRKDSVWSEESQRMIEVDSAEKLYNLSLINKRIEGVKRTQAAEQLAARTKSDSDEKSAKLAIEKLEKEEKLAEEYKKSRELVVGTLEGQKSEYQKIQDQIDKLQSTPWAKGELESERLAAIESLRAEQKKLLEDEMLANDEARSASRERLAIQQELINKVYALGNADDETLAKEKANAIKEIEDSGLIREQKDLLIEKTQEYYDKLEESKAIEAFADNMNKVLSVVTDGLGAIDNLQSAQTDRRIADIDRELKSKQDSLDAELQATLEAYGLEDETAVDKAQRELETAKETADEKTILEKENALKKAQIEEEYALKKTANDEAYARKKAEIEYNSAMVSWRLQKAMAIAEAAEAVLNAFSSSASAGIAGLIGAPAAAIIAGTFGALQVAAIDAAQPVKSFATGGIVSPSSSGQIVRVAENNSREILFNEGAEGQAFSQQMAGYIADALYGMMNLNIPVQIMMPDGRVLSETVIEYINNGRGRLKR